MLLARRTAPKHNEVFAVYIVFCAHGAKRLCTLVVAVYNERKCKTLRSLSSCLEQSNASAAFVMEVTSACRYAYDKPIQHAESGC